MSHQEDRRWLVLVTRAGRSALLAMAMAMSMALVRAQEEDPVTWKGAACSRQVLADSLPSAVAAIEQWSGFARATGSRLVLSDDGRVLLVLGETFKGEKNAEHREVEVMLDLVAQSAEVLDRVLKPPVGAAADTVVVIGVRRAHYERLLEHMVKLDARLAPWAGAAGRAACGFALSEPLVGAWIEDPDGVDEWHPYNELVHRTAQLLIRLRAPHVPDWLLLGLAWHVEDTVRGSIYCFPFRTGFVAALSHSDWGRWLVSAFKKSRRKMLDKPLVLTADEFAAWCPLHAKEFDVEAAYLAFGVARFLVRQHPDRIAGLLTRWSEGVEKGQKVWVSETEWTSNPDYQLPVDEQVAALENIQPGFLAAATRFFQKNGASKRVLAKTGKKHW